MARRIIATHDDRTRAKIQTTQLINRLTDHVMGKVELSASQVAAALGLIKKTLPDLTTVELNAEIKERHVINAQPMSLDEWEKASSGYMVTAGGATESTD